MTRRLFPGFRELTDAEHEQCLPRAAAGPVPDGLVYCRTCRAGPFMDDMEAYRQKLARLDRAELRRRTA